MKFRPVILFPIALVLVALIYAFGETRIKPDAKANAGMRPPMAGMTSHRGTETEESLKHVLGKATETLEPKQADTVRTLTQQAEAITGPAKADAYKKLAGYWLRTGNYITAGYYHSLAADANPTDTEERQLAARMLAMGINGAGDTTARMFAADRAIHQYEELIKVDTANTQAKVELALVYIEGLNDVMTGVLKLKDVEKIDPNNETMNLTLGRLAVVSGQFDKAIPRLEKLIKQHPDNAEAYVHLAEAYRATGQKDKALAELEACKRVVKDSPEAVKQVQQIITSIKNS